MRTQSIRETSLSVFILIAFLLATQGSSTAQKANGKPVGSNEEQALIVYIRLSDEKSGTAEERQKIFKLEDQIIALVEKSEAGEYDGNEIGEGFFTLYMYGTSASKLWDVTLPAIKSYPALPGSYAIKRYGKPGAKQDRVSLSE
jgi:hypothetical protein